MISVIIPVYKCDSCLNELYERLLLSLKKADASYEIIFINDCSPDTSWNVIKEIAAKDIHVKGINFSRNFGQHYAITAGLEVSAGDWVVVMDCDLQDQPEEIIDLYEKTKEGYDIIYAKRKRSNDSLYKVLLSKMFYKILGYLTDTIQDSSIGNFGLYHRTVIDSVLRMKDSMRYFPTMIRWVGYKSTGVNVEHLERKSGKSSYNIRKLLHLGLDVVLAFSDKPLRLAVKSGLFISGASVIFAIYFLIKYFKGEIEVTGWTSIIISIWFLSGMIIFVLGIVGLYLGKVLEKVKDRPLYIVKEKINI